MNDFRPIVLVTGLLAFALAPRASAGESIDFNTQIRPLLSNNCFACHGPDEEERAADLRLDTRTGATADRGGYAALIPGDPAASELLYRITTDDETDRMPPEGKGQRFTDREVALLERWIAQGGEYDRHWSYVKPQRPELPGVENTSWVRNPVDRFILARLEAEGLVPSPEADRLTLARRLALDLTGLPPTWEEARAFVRDSRPGAYDRYVGRLLDKPSFGERWARVWLDLARYADSAGYADDPPRTIWAYRDWVIRALNDNKPFDEFTIEQIAGDLLPDPTLGQRIATAFHRNTMTNNEGGTDNEEFRNAAVVDRVNTTMAVWMGTTINCAQCHTHKYDPITQEEYFRLFAIFNQTEDADQKDERPFLKLWSDEQKRNKAHWENRIAELRSIVETDTGSLREERRAWMKRLRREPEWTVLPPIAARAEHAELTVEADGTVATAHSKRPDTDRYSLKLSLPDDSPPITALRLEIDPAQATNFVLSRVSAQWTPAPDGPAAATSPSAGGPHPVEFDAAFASHEQEGFPASAVLAKKTGKKTGWAIAGGTGQRQHLTLLVGSPAPLRGGVLDLTLPQQSQYAQHVLTRFRITATTSPDASEWVRMPEDVRRQVRARNDTPKVARYYRSIAPSLQAARSELRRLEKRLQSEKPHTTVPVMSERSSRDRRTTNIQIRGNFQNLGKEVTPGVPAVFHPLRPDLPPNRLALAHWLVDADNPLTPRVIANRHWEKIFGTGIVETSEEFGSQGELPSHPKLLDWLAVELVESGWDLKHLLRTLVTSATYRQHSRVTDHLLEVDPFNRLYARGPRFRVPAEMVRDQALFATGLLSPRMYGPPVKPPQPNLGLKAAFGSATDWKTSEGANRYRRGLYTTWRRSNPYPSMATFDAPNREVCTIRRSRTNTPLQALVTLNDPVYVQAAQSLARTILQNDLRTGFRRALIRDPSPEEQARLEALYEEALAHYRASPEQTRQMVQYRPDTDEPARLAAWTVVANVILNLDEMLLKR